MDGGVVGKVTRPKPAAPALISGEELREELFSFDDIIEDPCDFTKVVELMPRLVEEAFEANKVEKGGGLFEN